MARLLVGALHDTYHGSASANLLVALGALLMSLCGTIVILSLCSLCSGRRRVGDKASSEAGDSSPAKPASTKNSSTAAMPKSNESSSSININAEEAVGAPQAPIKGGLVQEQKIPHRSPVWQRTILMGERCQRPTFSGLVLYDEKGNPLPRNEQGKM